MTIFYTNKFMIENAVEVEKNKPLESLPVGTVFTVHSVYGDSIRLKAIHLQAGKCVNTFFSVATIKFAFTESEELNGN